MSACGAAAFAERLPRRTVLVALDLVRAGVAVFLPFVTEIWQIYVRIFILQSASAGFTSTFPTFCRARRTIPRRTLTLHRGHSARAAKC